MTALAVSNVVLWAFVLALLLIVLALIRQLGVLHERIAPAGALMLNRGLQIGERVPMVDVSDLAGQPLRLGETAQRRPQHSAGIRLTHLPGVQIAAASGEVGPQAGAGVAGRSSSRATVIASNSSSSSRREQGLTELPFVISAPLGLTYQVSRLPFAALVDAAGILRARGLVNSREHLESLFEAQRLGVASLQEYFASRG